MLFGDCGAGILACTSLKNGEASAAKDGRTTIAQSSRRDPAYSHNQLRHQLAPSFPRKNVTPADVIPADSKPGKPGRESRRFLLEVQVVAGKAAWIPARAALGRNDGEWKHQESAIKRGFNLECCG